MFYKVIGILLSLLFQVHLCTAQRITYAKDIKSVIQKNCLSCHYNGGSTPFSLENYKDVAPRAKFISYVTANKIMPPWQANPSYSHFRNERLMSEDEIALIKKWVEQGSPKGFSLSLNSKSNVKKESQADLSLYMPEPLKIQGNNKNAYYCYKLPFELEKDTFGKVFEFIPSNLTLLHHASFQILEVHDSADIFKPPYYMPFNSESFMDDGGFYKKLNLLGPNAEYPSVLYGNSWLPGSTVQRLPDEFGFKIPHKGVILFNFIHYSPSPLPDQDSSGMRLYFHKKKPSRIIKELLFKPNFKGEEGMIPADSVRTIRFKKRIRGKISVFTVIPHMHRLGRYFKAYAIHNGKDTIPIVEIKDWNFNWQEYYQLNEPLVLDPSYTIHAEAVFDNTDQNLENPNKPPRTVYFNDNMDENSEMMHLIFLFSEYKSGDENLRFNDSMH